MVVGQELNATVGGDMQERIKGLRQSVAAVSQHYEAPKNWIGSSTVNLFQLVCEILDPLQRMNREMAAHKHLPGPAPSITDVERFSANAVLAKSLSVRVGSITQ